MKYVEIAKCSVFVKKKPLFMKCERSCVFLCNGMLILHENILLPTQEMIVFSKAFSKKGIWEKRENTTRILRT